MKTILVTLIHEGLTSQVGLIARIEYEGGEDNLEARFRGAARAFAATEEGRILLAGTHGDFNWGDALTEIPDEILKPWGILKIKVLAAKTDEALVLNHDTRLL